MAQFSHADFGGMSHWSPRMTMVGDMFNNGLKSKLDAVCTELAAHVLKHLQPITVATPTVGLVIVRKCRARIGGLLVLEHQAR
jgi:hypothetical protein